LNRRAVGPSIGSDFTQVAAGQDFPVIGANFEGFPASIPITFALDTIENVLPPTSGASPVYIFNNAWTTLATIPATTTPGFHIVFATLGTVTTEFIIQVCGPAFQHCSPRIQFISLETQYAEPLFLFNVGDQFLIDGDHFFDSNPGPITLWIDRDCLFQVNGVCSGTQFRTAGYQEDGHMSFQIMTMPDLTPGLHVFTAIGSEGESPSLLFFIE
jgi:hypothetical protein